MLDDAPVRFGDYYCAAVPRFDYRASPDFNQYWQLVLHCETMPEEKLTLAHDIAHDNLAAQVDRKPSTFQAIQYKPSARSFGIFSR